MKNSITLSLLLCGLILFASCSKEQVPGMEINLETQSARPSAPTVDEGPTANIFETNREYILESNPSLDEQKVPSQDLSMTPEENIYESEKNYIKESASSFEAQKTPVQTDDNSPSNNIFQSDKNYSKTKSENKSGRGSTVKNVHQEMEGALNIQGQNLKSAHDKRNNRTKNSNYISVEH